MIALFHLRNHGVTLEFAYFGPGWVELPVPHPFKSNLTLIVFKTLPFV